MTKTEMLQILIDGQAGLKKELQEVKKELRDGLGKVNKRIDTLGGDLAYLEDDAPTREEHDKLDKRVVKLEKKFISA